MSTQDQHYNFNHLSVKDLVEARDMFHAHLINKKNVIATAIGRYLIRKEDLDENGKMKERKPNEQRTKRTLQNSIVIDLSWPCILVFISKWENETDLLNVGASNIVPKTIYMPDGRMVPICIVEAPREHVSNTDVDISTLNFPVNYAGGGCPLIVHNQGIDHIATIGCVVSDGHKYYALTNKHVVGEGGETIKTIMGNEKIDIGISSGNFLGKSKFSDLYPGWENKNMLVSNDAGLIEISDIRRWKTDIIGMPVISELFDLNTLNISTGLIAEHSIKAGKVQDAVNGNVRAYGAVSGLMLGEILGLFYRYKSVGGVEYVSDFLVSGRNGNSLQVNHGDSGAVWLLEATDEDNNPKYMPIALHWGQHQVLSGTNMEKYSYSLSSSLSNICRELDVELIRGWNIDNDYSWGKVGHYTVGNAALIKIEDAKLKKLMNANLTNISFRDLDISKSLAEKGNPDLHNNPDEGFCPLADVPDIIWKQAKKSADGTRGTDWGRKGDENPNHYTDADAPTIGDGNTLYDLCPTQEEMTVDILINYYKNIDKEKIGLPADKDVSQGLVCFRVWQIYDYMTDAVAKNKKDQFIFAAGVLTHYLGDTCQPLHASFMSDGNPADNELVDYTAKRTSKKKDGTISHLAGDVYKKVVNPGSGVHVAYEDNMIDDHIDTMFPKLNALLADANSAVNNEAIPPVDSGQAAAFATLTLMRLTQEEIHPVDIVEAYKTAKANAEDVPQILFDAFGEKTVTCLARGCCYLAAIWEGAWKKGKETNPAGITDLTKSDTAALIALYRKPSELPSKHLDEINELLVQPEMAHA